MRHNNYSEGQGQRWMSRWRSQGPWLWGKYAQEILLVMNWASNPGIKKYVQGIRKQQEADHKVEANAGDSKKYLWSTAKTLKTEVKHIRCAIKHLGADVQMKSSKVTWAKSPQCRQRILATSKNAASSCKDSATYATDCSEQPGLVTSNWFRKIDLSYAVVIPYGCVS